MLGPYPDPQTIERERSTSLGLALVSGIWLMLSVFHMAANDGDSASPPVEK